MAFLTTKLLGLDEVLGAIDKLGEHVDLAAREMVVRSGAIVELFAKGEFSGAHPKGAPHVGGDRPNVVTGTLRRSVRSDPVRLSGAHQWSTTVGPREIYGRRVELGYNGSAAYPYFEPGVAKVLPKLIELRAEILGKYL